MTDEMKLLTALCEALGFEVKREVIVHTKLGVDPEGIQPTSEYKHIGHDCYEHGETLYTLTKKKPEVGKWVNY